MSFVWRRHEKVGRVVNRLQQSNPDIGNNLLESQEIEMVTPGGTWELVEKPKEPVANGVKDKIFTINGVEFDLKDK